MLRHLQPGLCSDGYYNRLQWVKYVNVFVIAWFVSFQASLTCHAQNTVLEFPETVNQEAVTLKTRTAFVINFLKFTNWPSDSFETQDSPLVVGLFGENVFGSEWKKYRGRVINGHPLEFRSVSTLKGALDCHAVYFSPGKQSIVKKNRERFQEHGVLTITEGKDYTQEGVIISLYQNRTKFRFVVNLQEAKSSDIQLSSNLLKLAEITEVASD